MRALPILASLLLAAPFAHAANDLDLLQSRCAEQERQIKELEEKNARLESLLSSSQRTVPLEAPASSKLSEGKGSGASTSDKSASYATVRKGDTLANVARRNGTTADTLAKLNGLKDPTSIRAGQKLRLPASAPAVAATTKPEKEKEQQKEEKPAPTPAAKPAERSPSGGGTHIVKQGETFYSIARRYGMSADTLQAANPGIKTTALRPGLTLRLQATAAKSPAPKSLPPATAPASKPAPRSAIAKQQTTPTPTSKPAAREKEKDNKAESPKPVVARSTPAKETSKPAETRETALAANDKPTSTPAPAETHEPAANKPTIRSVNLAEKTTFGAFAAAHGTSTDKLNALNGLSLASSTVLKEGSELYVPAQP